MGGIVFLVAAMLYVKMFIIKTMIWGREGMNIVSKTVDIL
jgi:hypothetical protein